MHGAFVEVYLSAAVTVCEARDKKGIYARIKGGFLGEGANIGEYYEPPARPEIVADSSRHECATLVAQTLQYLTRQGYLAPVPEAAT